MRRAWILIGLLGLMAVSSCSSASCCDTARDKCFTPDLPKGTCHGCAAAAIREAGFTKHPFCRGNLGHYNWYVLDVPLPGGDEYDCGTELDLTFVSPKGKQPP